MLNEKYYTLSDIAKFTKLTDRTIRNYLANGTLKGHKVGGQWRFSQEDVKALFSNDKFEDDMKIKTEKNILSYYNDKYSFNCINNSCVIINITISNKNIRKEFFKEIKTIPCDVDKKEQIMFIDENGHIKIVVIASFDYIHKINEIVRRYVK